jgi:hypothetical protein
MISIISLTPWGIFSNHKANLTNPTCLVSKKIHVKTEICIALAALSLIALAVTDILGNQ